MLGGKTKIAAYLVLALALLLLANPCFCYDDPGTSARATGMGNAFVGVADDPSAIFYNPAGLARLKTWHLAVLYDKRSTYGLEDSENPFLASGVVVYPIRENLCVGASGYQRGSWSDPTQVVTNNIGQLSLSAQVNEKVSLGVSGKVMYNSNYGKKKGVDFDLGFLYQPGGYFSIGIAGENLLATDMRPEVPDKSSLVGYSTRKGKVGLSYVHDDEDFLTKVALDVVLKDVQQPMKKVYTQESFGVEQWIFNRKEMSFAVRGGYTLGKDYELDYSQPALGCGMRYRGEDILVQIDYSWQRYPYQPTERFAGDHRLSFTFSPSWGKEVSKDVGREAQLHFKKRQQETQPQKPVSKYRNRFAPDSKAHKFDLNSRVENVSSDRSRSVVFLLRPQVDFDVYEWRLYICEAKPSGWNDDQIEPYLVKMIGGKGMPGFGVVWDVGLKDNEVKRGDYFYSLRLVDRKGQWWHSNWRSFKVE